MYGGGIQTIDIQVMQENINFHTDTSDHESTTISSLTITNAIKSYTGYFWLWIETLSLKYVCEASLAVVASTYIYEYDYFCMVQIS